MFKTQEELNLKFKWVFNHYTLSKWYKAKAKEILKDKKCKNPKEQYNYYLETSRKLKDKYLKEITNYNWKVKIDSFDKSWENFEQNIYT